MKGKVIIIKNLYVISSITDLAGNLRTDGNNKKRINSKAELLSNITNGFPMFFKYKFSNNDNIVETHITQTSLVNTFSIHNGQLQVKTENSIYNFVECKKGEEL